MVRFTKENQLSRAELARRHEESLYAKFKLITKQSNWLVFWKELII